MSLRAKALLLLIVLSLTLGLTELVLRLVPEPAYDPGQMEAGLAVYDNELGWRLQPGWSGPHRHQEFSVTYTINNRGFRVAPGAAASIPSARDPVLVLGDSFTFGIGVNDGETLVSQLKAEVPGTPFLNGGVVGYSTDQQSLYLKRLQTQFKLSGVVWIVYLGNDLIDNLRPYPIQADQAKPYFTRRSGSLELRNTPVPMQPKTADWAGSLYSEAIAPVYRPGIILRALDKSAIGRRLVKARNRVTGWPELSFGDSQRQALELFGAILGRHPDIPVLLVLLPGKTFLAEDSNFTAQYQDHLRKEIPGIGLPANFTILDIAPVLKAADDPPAQPMYFPREGHLTAAGHREVARILADSLTDWLPAASP